MGLVIEHVTKNYGKLQALKGISMELKKRGSCGIVGA